MTKDLLYLLALLAIAAATLVLAPPAQERQQLPEWAVELCRADLWPGQPPAGCRSSS